MFLLALTRTNPSVKGMDFVGLNISVVMVMLRLTLGIAEEGQCFSRFDYEEKLLGKVIRTDIRMQEVMDRLETVMETMKAHRREFEEIKTRVERTSEDTIATVNDQWKDMAQQIESFRDILRSPTIAFNVRGATDKSPTTGQIIVFETIILNTGAAFDSHTGIFTSPVNGTFFFCVQVCSAFRQNGSFKLVTDDVTLLSISNYNYISSFTSTSGSTVYRLTVGQRVWVQNEHDAGSSANLEDSDKERACWNQFSGVMIDLDLN